MRRRGFLVVLAGTTSAGALRAEQNAIPVVGFLGNLSPKLAASFVAAFKDGLGTTGFIDGQNVAIEYRWAEGHYDRLPGFANEFANHKVSVIIAAGTPGIRAAKNATTTIPIIFTGGGDLIAAGLVASLARPGGNLTGISIFGRELHPKRFQLLCELVPTAEMIALLVNPDGYSGSEAAMRDLQEAARMNGRLLTISRPAREARLMTLSLLSRNNAPAPCLSRPIPTLPADASNL